MAVQYLPITIDDLQEVTRIYMEHLNGGDFIEEHIKEGIESKDFVGFKAVDQGRMIGILTGRQGMDFTYPHPELEERIHKRYQKDNLYTPDSLYVEPEYRGEDISRQLGKHVVQKIYEKGYSKMLTELWIYPDGKVPAEATVREWGPVVYQEDIPLFYKDSYQYGIECPICGAKCTCGARILVVEISEEFVREGDNNE